MITRNEYQLAIDRAKQELAEVMERLAQYDQLLERKATLESWIRLGEQLFDESSVDGFPEDHQIRFKRTQVTTKFPARTPLWEIILQDLHAERMPLTAKEV